MKCLQPLEETETALEDTLEESVTATMWDVLSCSWRATILIKHLNQLIKVYRMTRNYQTSVLRQKSDTQVLEYKMKTKEVIKSRGIHTRDILCFKVK